MSEIFLVGYDCSALAVEYQIPPALEAEAKRLADIPADDPDVTGAYELKPAIADKIAKLISVKIDTKSCDFFLEGFADASD